jgi:hypothetical protein
VAVYLRVVAGGPADADEGAVQAEQFLDGLRDQLGLLPELDRDLLVERCH